MAKIRPLALGLFRRAVIVGPENTCRAIGLGTPHYYRWVGRVSTA